MGKLLKIVDPYILAMLLVIALAAVLPARGAGAPIASGAADAGVVFLFFLYGARLSAREALGGMMQWKLQIAILLCTFGLFPLLGLGIAGLAPASFPPTLVTGFVFLTLLPSTVQSSIAFTAVARGNVAASLCAATISNMLGVFLSPLMVGWLLKTSGVALDFSVFADIILKLMAPFLLGQALRRWIGGFVMRNRGWLSYFDRGSILLIIYSAFSRGMVDHIWSRIDGVDLIVLMLVLTLLLAIVLVASYLLGSRVLGEPIENVISLQFCGSKKSLASGLPMATVLFTGSSVSLVVLPLMLFHQIQLFVCAFLARHYGSREEIILAELSGEPA